MEQTKAQFYTPEQFKVSVSYLQNLTKFEVNMGKCLKNIESLPNVCSSLENCINLEYLYFRIEPDQFSLNSEQGIQVASALKNCLKLQKLELFLRLNHLGEIGVSYISLTFLKFNQLQHLQVWLRFNKIGDKGVAKLTSDIVQIPNLKTLTLDLSINQISNQGIQDMGSYLSGKTSLAGLKLYLENNLFDSSGVISFFSQMLSIIECENCYSLLIFGILRYFKQIEVKIRKQWKKQVFGVKRLVKLKIR